MYVHLNEPIYDGILAKLPFGGRCYGTSIASSDSDYLVLIKQDTGDLILRYDNRIDDLTYVGIKSFWKTMSEGAEQVYFEAMHTPEFEALGTPFKPLMYYNNRVARMYVGYAKRDLKQNAIGRLFHINRCLWMADKVMKKELINLIDVKNIPVETDIGKLKQRMTSMREELKCLVD
jgi:hypothetical protein